MIASIRAGPCNARSGSPECPQISRLVYPLPSNHSPIHQTPSVHCSCAAFTSLHVITKCIIAEQSKVCGIHHSPYSCDNHPNYSPTESPQLSGFPDVTLWNVAYFMLPYSLQRIDDKIPRQLSLTPMATPDVLKTRKPQNQQILTHRNSQGTAL